MADVAQLVRASGCGSEGRGFDPRRLPHLSLFALNPQFSPVKKILMEIIFFAALAAVIFFKLFKEFGKIDEEEKSRIEQFFIKKQEQIKEVQRHLIDQAKKQIVEKTLSQLKVEEEILSKIDEPSRAQFSAILTRCNITADFFLNGAKSVFEMVLKNFAEGNLANLQTMLSDNIYRGFESAINHRNLENKKMVTNLISIDDAQIISAQIIDNNAFVVVSLNSKQINYILSQIDEVVEGSKSEISQLRDVWTFKKDLNSSDPNWVVNSTVN